MKSHNSFHINIQIHFLYLNLGQLGAAHLNHHYSKEELMFSIPLIGLYIKIDTKVDKKSDKKAIVWPAHKFVHTV